MYRRKLANVDNNQKSVLISIMIFFVFYGERLVPNTSMKNPQQWVYNRYYVDDIWFMPDVFLWEKED